MYDIQEEETEGLREEDIEALKEIEKELGIEEENEENIRMSYATFMKDIQEDDLNIFDKENDYA